jgi:hypothetical protein
MTHLIEKQTIELRLAKADDAFALQHAVSAFFHNQLLPALDDLFGRLAPSHRRIRLSELVIDLGNVSEQQLLTTAFLETIIAQAERQIEASVRDNPTAVVGRFDDTNVFVQWLYFLENGRLPWYAYGKPPNFEAEVPKVLARSEAAIVQLQGLVKQQPTALQRLIRQHDAAFLALIAGLYTGSVQTDLARVADALGQFMGRNSVEMFWQWVFKQVIFLREKWSATDLITRSLSALLEAFARRKMGQMGSREAFVSNEKVVEIYRKSFEESGKMFEKKQNSLTNSENTEGVVLRDILPDGFPFLLETESFLRQYQPNNAWILREKAVSDALKRDDFLSKNREKGDAKMGVDLHKKMIDETRVNQDISLTQNLENTEGASMSDLGFGISADAQPLPFIETGHDEVTNKNLDEIVGLSFENEAARPEGRATDAEVTELYVTNAGLVLLHPFLSRLFDNLGLTNGGIFVDKQLKDKALTVLHYLATGETRALEYHLMLPKLLCQMPFNQPISGHWALSEEEKTTCDGLLEVAIEYWSALGKTSPEGLREAFLQRKGKLIHRPSGWLLQVERTTIDVLVDRLPWGLGVVKLPWMRDFMTVEW